MCAVLLLQATAEVALAMIEVPFPQNPKAPENCTADFVVFGDSQGSFDPIWTISPDIDKFFGVINQIDTPMAFHLGDMYTGDTFFAASVTDQAKWFLEDKEILNIPLYPVMGNHDARGDGWAVTRETFFKNQSTYYSFDRGDSHFVVLDAFMPGYEHTLSPDQMAWLKNDLTHNEKDHVFVFVHAPLYPLGPHLGGSLDKDVAFRDDLASFMVENGVDVVFSGHEHFYASFEYEGLTQVISGGAGGRLASPEEFDELEEEYGYDFDQIDRWVTKKSLNYICVSTTPDSIEITAYDLEGNIIDQFTVMP